MRKVKKPKETITKYGIADCYGIECLFTKGEPESPPVSILFLRAESNRHRHAVLFEVGLFDKTDKVVTGLLKEEKFAEALEALKALALRVAFPKNRVDLYSKSWNLIPNAGLDPWG